MTTLQDLLLTRYVKHGRTMPDLDCGGLVRVARHALFGKSLLPAFADVDPADKPALTQAAQTVIASGFVEVPAQPGAIAAAWRGALCVHLGICVEADGRLWVLETDEPTGPVLTPVSAFESRYRKVVYYDD